MGEKIVFLYGDPNKSRICNNDECTARLSIHNCFDICNICRKAGLKEVLVQKSGVIDTVAKFDKEHRVNPVKQYSRDVYLPIPANIRNPKRED